MLKVKNDSLNIKENHYEEFQVDDLNNTNMEDGKLSFSSKDLVTKSSKDNKRFSDLLKLKNLKFKDSGVDLPNILNEYEEKTSKVIYI